MKYFKPAPVLFVLIILSLIVTARGFIYLSGSKMKIDNPKDGFVLIELFTSEGCSSCPPADALVARIQEENNNKPVYILSFHVDYWNHLGWKDPFSNAAFSNRQKNYANLLNLQSVYTPQVVVNGQIEFVGSDEGRMKNAIKNSLQKKSAALLSLQKIQKNTDQAIVGYHIENGKGNISLNLAVVQKSATIKVERGENGGHTLSHVQIVLNLQMISLNGKNSGTTQVTLPSNLDHQEFEIIGFLQSEDTGEILAAAKINSGLLR